MFYFGLRGDFRGCRGSVYAGPMVRVAATLTVPELTALNRAVDGRSSMARNRKRALAAKLREDARRRTDRMISAYWSGSAS